jgi:hypothetical protein
MTKSIITRYTIRGILQSQHNHDQQDGPKLASCPLLLLVLTIGIATLQRRQRHARQRLPSGHSILQIFPPSPNGVTAFVLVPTSSSCLSPPRKQVAACPNPSCP